MEKLSVQEVIVVEGKYDVNALKQVIDGIVVTTDGFGVFHNQEKLQLIRRMADTRGVIILTDSDGAGFVIRNYLKGALPKERVKHAYIPDIYGKERRKRTGSKERKLGVEGMSPYVLKQVLERAGAIINGESTDERKVTKADLYVLGLSGTPNSAVNRKLLLSALELPERLSSNALLDVINALFSFETFCEKWESILEQNQHHSTE